MVGRKVAPEQFAATLFKIAGDWKSAGEKIDALSYSAICGLAFRGCAIKRRPRMRLGDSTRPKYCLPRSRALKVSLTKAENHEREILEEIHLRKRRVADTKAAQAAVAHARLEFIWMRRRFTAKPQACRII